MKTCVLVFHRAINGGDVHTYPVVAFHINDMLTGMEMIILDRRFDYPACFWGLTSTGGRVDFNGVILRQVIGWVANEGMVVETCVIVVPDKQYGASFSCRHTGEVVGQPGWRTLGSPGCVITAVISICRGISSTAGKCRHVVANERPYLYR